jgi:hypothetical protein
MEEVIDTRLRVGLARTGDIPLLAVGCDADARFFIDVLSFQVVHGDYSFIDVFSFQAAHGAYSFIDVLSFQVVRGVYTST